MRFGRRGRRIFWSEVRASRLKTGDLDNDLNHIQQSNLKYIIHNLVSFPWFMPEADYKSKTWVKIPFSEFILRAGTSLWETQV